MGIVMDPKNDNFFICLNTQGSPLFGRAGPSVDPPSEAP